MKKSTIQWHLARDNQLQLARFCEKNSVRSQVELYTYKDEEHDYWQKTFTFNNGGFITAEMLHGGYDKSYSVADHFQVVDYALGTN